MRPIFVSENFFTGYNKKYMYLKYLKSDFFDVQLVLKHKVLPDRFSAKCHRVLHSAIIVEMYVPNISNHPFISESAFTLRLSIRTLSLWNHRKKHNT